MISMGGVIERQLCPLLNLNHCSLDCASPIEIFPYSLLISNIELIFTKYGINGNPAFYNIWL